METPEAEQSGHPNGRRLLHDVMDFMANHPQCQLSDVFYRPFFLRKQDLFHYPTVIGVLSKLVSFSSSAALMNKEKGKERAVELVEEWIALTER